MLKSVMTTIVLVLALVQALGMAQVRGYVRILPLLGVFATVHFSPSNQTVITNCTNIRMSRMFFIQF